MPNANETHERADAAAVAGLAISATTLALQAADSQAVRNLVSKVKGTGEPGSGKGGSSSSE